MQKFLPCAIVNDNAMRTKTERQAKNVGAYEIVINIKLEDPFLHTSYRRAFTSFIKGLLNNYDKNMYNLLYGKRNLVENPFKPISFYVYFPELQPNKNSLEHILTGNKAELRIRTYNPQVFYSIYMSAKNFMKDQLVYPIYNNKAYIEDVNFEMLYPIKNNIALFKTLAPIVLEKRYNDDEKCITPQDEDFVETFLHYVNVCAEHTIGVRNVDKYVAFQIIDYKIVKIRHYDKLLHALKCQFVMQAPNQVLNAIYFAGLGAKRSQGFGILKPIG